MPDRAPWVVFTDLDATLLDHDDYGWQAAAPSLAELAERGVPVCPITSKTAAEVAELRHALGSGHPFASENGAAIAVPEGYFEHEPTTAETPLVTTLLGVPRTELRGVIERLRERHGYACRGFGDMSIDEIVEHTGLAYAAAARAAERQASEPLLWQDSEAALADFHARIEAEGLTLRRGGRFVHVLGGVDKGRALARLRARYEARLGPITAIALGDSANDADMLAAADIGYWVAKPDGSYQAPAGGPIRHAPGIGPAGWAAAVAELIAQEYF